jgi:hypothetical protein
MPFWASKSGRTALTRCPTICHRGVHAEQRATPPCRASCRASAAPFQMPSCPRHSPFTRARPPLPLPRAQCVYSMAAGAPPPWPPWPSSAPSRPRCFALHSSKPTAPSSSSPHAAPPALLRRPCRGPLRCCRLPTSPRPPARVARPRRATTA